MTRREGRDAEQTVVEMSADELASRLRALGEPAYRARQIRRWIYRERVVDFARMTDLPAALRERLAASLRVLPVEPVEEVVSADGLTRKALLGLSGGSAVETVLMLYPGAEAEGDEAAMERRTVCVSSQVGCAIGCPFCATGASGFQRNLSAGEIVGQVLHFAGEVRAREADARISNVVLMGQGEPLANLGEVRRAVEMLNDPESFGLGARHVTISTAGLVPGIRALADWPLQVGLAISLHAPDDALRDRLVPVNRRYPIAVLLAACRDYVRRTNRRVSFEYAMISGVNDSPAQADRLAGLLSGFLGHVNLIPLNAVAESPFQPSPRARVLAFQARLRQRGIPCTVRAERGDPIAAACGQLRARRLAAPLTVTSATAASAQAE